MPTSPALVGRTAELARLLDVATADDGASCRLVVIAGEAGIGKTRLMDELVTASAGTVPVVRGRAEENDRTAFGLWLPVLRQLDLPRPGTDSSVPTSEQRWEIVDLLASALGGMAPVLVLLDDLHWADEAGLWVLEQLLDRCSERPVAIVAATRRSSEVRAPKWHALYRRAEVIALDGLDVAEVAELAAHLGASPGDTRTLWQRTGGNPLFVREQLVAGDTTMPATIEGLLAAGIDRLEPGAADVVALVALAGGSTPREVLAAAGSSTLDDLDRHLQAAARADILRGADDGVRFRHDLLAEAALRRLGVDDRHRLHLAIADAWARLDGTLALQRQAHHRLLAIPAVDANDAAESTLSTASELRAKGQTADAAALLQLAGATIAGRRDVGAALKARVALAEGEARWALDDFDGATAACAVALEQAGAAGDPALLAAAEVAALTHHSPVFADPVAVARLAALDEQLADDDTVDPVLRIRLAGRRAVLTMAIPDRIAEAAALGDDAVARARRLGDPKVIVGALSDRFAVLATPADYDAKERAAAEIIELARAAHRPELALLGHEWTYATRGGVGDLPGAIAALDDLETLAAIMPSPLWRYSVAVRRCGIVALLGDYEGAISMAASSRQLGAGVVPATEAAALEIALRLMPGVLYGRDDHGAEPIHRAMAAAAGEPPVLFVQATSALGDAMFGDPASSRRRLTPWIDRFDVALGGHEGLLTLSVAAHTVVMLDWAEAAPSLRDVLRPFAGRMPVGNAVAPDVSVDHHLGALALLAGDIDEAVRFAGDAVDFARRMRSPVLEARALALLGQATERAGDRTAAASAFDAADNIAAPLGMRLPGRESTGIPDRRAQSVDGSAEQTVALRFDNGRWFIQTRDGDAHVADSTGMHQLVRLVTSPGKEIAAVDLAGAASGQGMVVSTDLGAALDGRAKREYRRRITELQADIDEAEDYNDPERAAKHRLEMEAILAELRAAVGLGGRDRPQGSGNERARINAARNIRRSIAAIASVLPRLGAHLDVSIRTGHSCSYAPEPAAALTWQVDA